MEHLSEFELSENGKQLLIVSGGRVLSFLCQQKTNQIEIKTKSIGFCRSSRQRTWSENNTIEPPKLSWGLFTCSFF